MVARCKELSDADVFARVRAVGLVAWCALFDLTFAKTVQMVRERKLKYDTNDLHTDWKIFHRFFWPESE